MSLIVSIGGVEYLPLRAVPFVARGVLSIKTIANMVAHPDDYCDGLRDTVLVPYHLSSGQLSPVDYSPFHAIAIGEFPEVLPAALLVRKDAVLSMYGLIVQEVWTKKPRLAVPGVVWDENPALSSEQMRYISEGVYRLRKNGKDANRRKLEEAMHSIEMSISQDGLAIDRERMPRPKATWIRIFKIETGIHFTEEVYEGYLSEIGLRWTPGAKHSAAEVFASLEKRKVKRLRG